jgi:hypothetical protein
MKLSFSQFLFLLLGLCGAVQADVSMSSGWPEGAKISDAGNAPKPLPLRAYGTTSVVPRMLQFGGVTFDLDVVQSADQEHAVTTVGKYLADLDLSPGVTKSALTVNGKSFVTVSVPGGTIDTGSTPNGTAPGSIYTGFVVGQTGYVIAAPSAEALQQLLAAAPLAKRGTLVTKLTYPSYLDRFDRYGWGFYGLDPSFQRPTGEDPADDFDFCAKNSFRFELWPNPVNLDESYSIADWPGMRWKVEEAEKRGIPTSVRSYIGGGDNILPVRKELTEIEQLPPPDMDFGWYGPSLEYRSRPQQSWFNRQAQLYGARQTQDMMRGMLRIDPDLQSWMMPYGEISSPIYQLAQVDRSPAAIEAWHHLLRDTHKLSLAQVAAMYGRAGKPFTSWDDVIVPEFDTFEGGPGMVVDLDNDWYLRTETTPDEGLTGHWIESDLNSGAWEKMDLPGDTRWHKYYRRTNWLAREFTVTSALIDNGSPVYLYNFIGTINGDPRQTIPTYLNGQKIGAPGTWGAWDVTKILKPGTNRVVIRTGTQTFAGHVFLSTEKPTLYPYMDPDRARLWALWNEYGYGGQFDSTQTMLQAMREVDPNRQIKIMAPHQENIGQWIEMESKYGAWGHFTGEGTWFFPWLKRSDFLYDIPGTSEGAGPPAPDITGVPDLYLLMQRVFLEGLNAHDQTFTVQNITRAAPLKKWYEDHIAVLRQLGRYDISGAQVLIFRSMDYGSRFELSPIPGLDGAKETEVQNIYNWDIGRGTLQSIGQSPLYVDDVAVKDGKLTGYPVLVDCGNEIMRPDTIQKIGDWVKQGGTYVVWPFTGRSVATAPDSWPIQALTGCQVKTIRKPGQGSVTIEKNQDILKGLAGQTFPDNGSSLDYQNFEHNLISTELQPGTDCQVLAHYENGAAAIVSHTLGKGRVITLGSAFFRGVHDVVGIWRPEQKESTFFNDLLTGIGQPPVNTTTDHFVWPQRYKTNNGLDDVVVLVNFADGDRQVDLHATLDQKPAKIYRFAMNEMSEVTNFTANNGDVTIPQIAIPKGEVQVYYFRTANALAAADHWWTYQRRMWHPLATPPKIDFKSISSGHWVDPTVDLKREWKWTQDVPEGSSDWQAPTFADTSWKNWDLGIFNAEGADAAKPVYARKVFTFPKAWLTDGGRTRMTASGQWYPFTAGDGDFKFYLNGQSLEKKGFFSPDVSKILHAGDNTLALKLDKPRHDHLIGVFGALYLVHEKPPVKTVSLAGAWNGTADGKPVTLTWPGTGTGTAVEPSREIEIPADWKDKYVVTYYAKGDGNSIDGIIVDHRNPVRRAANTGDDVEIDITPYLHFGGKDLLTPMGHDYVGKMNAPTPWNFSQIELRLYPKSDYRN